MTPVRALQEGVRRLLGLPSREQLDAVNAALRAARAREADARESAAALDAELHETRRREAMARAEADEQRQRADLAETMAIEAFETLDRQARLLGGQVLPLSDELCRETVIRSRREEEH